MIKLIQALDDRILNALYAHRSLNGSYIFIAISQAGEWYVILGFGAALTLWLAMRERFAYAAGIILAIATSGIGTFLLKSAIARPRPPQSYWAYTETWYSFPSAHAAMSLAFFGLLAWMVWRSGVSRMARIAVMAATVVLIVAIDFSRLYLGVHYFSDVVGGSVLGALCLYLSIWFIRSYTDKT